MAASSSTEPRVFQLKSRLFIDIIVRWTSVRVTRIRYPFISSPIVPRSRVCVRVYLFFWPLVARIISIFDVPANNLFYFFVYVWHILIRRVVLKYSKISGKFCSYIRPVPPLEWQFRETNSKGNVKASLVKLDFLEKFYFLTSPFNWFGINASTF